MTANDQAAPVRPLPWPVRQSRWFVLSCEVSGQRYEFSALPNVEDVAAAILDPTIPLNSPLRYGMSVALAWALAGGALERPGEPVAYGETLLLRMEAEA